MKKIALCICLLLAMPLISAQSQDPILSADFEEGDIPPALITLGDWQIEDGRLVGRSSTEVTALLVEATRSEPSYTLQMDMRVSGEGSMGLLLHGDLFIEDCLVGHYADITLPSTVFVGSVNTRCKDTPLELSAEGFQGADTWVRLTVEVDLDFISIRVDDTLLAEGTVPELVAGDLTIWLFEGSTLEIEALEISAATRRPAASPKIILREYDGDYQDAIAELQQLDLIPKGGRLLFTEDYAFFSGRGSYFTALAANSPRQNVVLAGEITFDAAGAQTEICGLSARLVSKRDGSTDTFISANFINDGTVILVDNVGGETNNINGLPLNLDFGSPHHILVILLDDQASLFVDGQAIVENMAVETRAGTFGISLVSESADSRCEGRNIWVYSLD